MEQKNNKYYSYISEYYAATRLNLKKERTI